jgi:integrase
LKAGVDLITISHWLGHASINTTNKYTAIDLAMKRDANAQAKSLGEHARDAAPWRKDASILEWLDVL